MDHKLTNKNGQVIPSLEIPYALVGILAIFYGFAAYFFPIVQDEAYYYNWGKRLALGYFDHPPAVAWLSAFSTPFGSQVLNGRFGTVLFGVMSICLLFNLYRLSCFPCKRMFHTTCVLGAGNLAAIACGFLTTPDAVIMFAWTLALHEAAAAMSGSPKRWLSAGAAVGLGLLGKYTMLLMGPVFLTSLWFGARRQLLSKWPYLGGLVALLVFTPNLIWNQQNNWVTWKFQLKHGLAQHRSLLVSGQLPNAIKPELGSREFKLASVFSPYPGQSVKEAAYGQEVPTKYGNLDKLLAAIKQLSKADTLIKRLSEFIFGQLAFWGLLLLVLFGASAAKIRRRFRSKQYSIPASLKALLFSACFWPLFVFGLFALNGKVEANWAAMHLITAAPILAYYLRPNLKLAIFAAAGNLFLIAGIILYTRFPFVKVNPGFDRILAETHGFSSLAKLPDIQEPAALFADSFQLVSMLRYHNHQLKVGQWPGVTRVSEYVLNESYWSPYDLQGLRQKGRFLLLTSDDIPPRIPGFMVEDLKKIQDCRQGYLKEQTSWIDLDMRKCEPLRRWFLVDYVVVE